MKCSWCFLTRWINEKTCNFTQQPHKQWITHLIHFNIIKSPSLVIRYTFDASVSDMRSYMNYFCDLHVFFFFFLKLIHDVNEQLHSHKCNFSHCAASCAYVSHVFFLQRTYQLMFSILWFHFVSWQFILILHFFFFWYILPSFCTHSCDWYVTQRRQTARLRKLLQHHNGGLVACSVALPVTWMTVPPRFFLLL